jgi:hypothetical protein
MRTNSPAVLAIAALLLTPSSLLFAQAAEAQSGQNPQAAADLASASQEATKMVSATAAFITAVDSHSLTAGTQVKLKLQGKVRLENGPVLPSGTIVVGQAVDDKTETGKATVALRFTEADLKNGQIVPIKATIVNVYKQTNEIAAGQFDVAAVSLGWDKETLIVDQLDAIPGVDLHSKIASPNSGVFVSTKKNDIKFTPAVEVELAIAPRSGSADQTANGY